MTLSDKTKQTILNLQKKYPHPRSALIPALHLAQAEIGYLPHDVQQEVADLFDLDVNEVQAIVTFYDMFFEKPVGKHLIHICKNVSCMLRGCDEVLEALCTKLKVRPGETTSDGEFTVIACECLAHCDLAPMMLVDEEAIGPIRTEEVDAILAKAKQGRGHPSPVCCSSNSEEYS